jgi:protein TonB
MSYALSYASSRPSICPGAAACLALSLVCTSPFFLVVLAAKTIVPQIMEMPLIVDLLQAPEVQKPPEAKPLPMAKPQPVKQPRMPTPKAPTPVIEATTSSSAGALGTGCHPARKASRHRPRRRPKRRSNRPVSTPIT